MVYKGHVVDGVIVLDEPANLPDGTVVVVEVQELSTQKCDLELAPAVLRVSGILPSNLDARDVYLESRVQKHK